MKYNIKAFDKAVEEYKQILKKHIKEKILFIETDFNNKKAFFSLAPLSKAVHELKGDMQVVVKDQKITNLNLKKQISRN